LRYEEKRAYLLKAFWNSNKSEICFGSCDSTQKISYFKINARLAKHQLHGGSPVRGVKPGPSPVLVFRKKTGMGEGVGR